MSQEYITEARGEVSLEWLLPMVPAANCAADTLATPVPPKERFEEAFGIKVDELNFSKSQEKFSWFYKIKDQEIVVVADYYEKINTMEYADKQALFGKIAAGNVQPVATTNGPGEIDGDYITYTVRRGDSIWDIVKMFDNVFVVPNVIAGSKDVDAGFVHFAIGFKGHAVTGS